MATEFGILGELQCTQDGAPRDLGPWLQRSLLAHLLIRRDQPISTERLMDELWPDEAPEVARHRLHVHVSRLRAVLGEERERLVGDPTGYRLTVRPDELDAARFVAAAAEGRAALDEGDLSAAEERFRAALAMWRGPALAEFADEPFARAEAERLEQLRLAALEGRFEAGLALGRHGQLIEALRKVTLEQPYREAFCEQLMLALYRAGRQTDALHAYSEARVRLADDLGIEPGPALQRMEQRILAHDPTLILETTAGPVGTVPPASPPGNLPLQRTTFVGRERDLAIADELLAASRLLTLTGPPGAGKTRMALRLASDHAERYPAGAFFVSLATVNEAQQLEPAITRVLETADALDAPAGDAADDGLSVRLARRRLLLILDNLEQVIGAAGPVGRLLDGAVGLTILATSRAPLGVVGEQEYPVSPLELPPADTPADPAIVSQFDSVALLVARARAADPGFEVTPSNAGSVAGITRCLDGLPLAIELGATRLRALTPADLLDRLERRLPLLTSGSSDAIDRHQTLRAAIAWSYELLSAEERHLFRCLSSLVGSFTAGAAAAVADRSVEDTWTGIESLVAQSLLQRPVDLGEARFAMLQTIREFALEQLGSSAESEVVFERHAGYYLGLAEQSREGPSGDRGNEAIATLSSELDEVRAALHRCIVGGDRDLGLRLAGATWRAWHAAGRITEGREWLTRLLDPPGPDLSARAEALVALAGLDYWQADFPAAREAYEEALGLYRTTGDRRGEAEVLFGLSTTATWDGDPVEGARLAAEARVLFESLGARAQVGETLMAEGFALLQQHEYAASRPLWEAALAISREVGADTLAVTQLSTLAVLEYQAGAPREATRIALECLDMACDLDNVPHCVWMLDFVAAYAVPERPVQAVRVAGAADALRAASGGGMPIEDLDVEPARVAARNLLDPAELDDAWAEGRTWDLEQAIDAARSLRPESGS